jgi:hypothetical protein
MVLQTATANYRVGNDLAYPQRLAIELCLTLGFRNTARRRIVGMKVFAA